MFEILRRNKTGRSLVQFTLQHGAPNGTERRCGTLPKMTRHGYAIGRSCIRMRFLCDVLLFSASMVQLQKMMCDFKQSAESVVLKIHLDKTKILSNQVEINNIKVEILSACESAKYLGQTTAFSNWKQQRSKIESERPRHRSTDTNKS